ncbi:hypothetical protein STEG23_020111, partial [Scotinomys teguina]
MRDPESTLGVCMCDLPPRYLPPLPVLSSHDDVIDMMSQCDFLRDRQAHRVLSEYRKGLLIPFVTQPPVSDEKSNQKLVWRRVIAVTLPNGMAHNCVVLAVLLGIKGTFCAHAPFEAERASAAQKKPMPDVKT